MSSSTFSKESLLALVLRALALVLILTTVGSNIVVLPQQIKALRQGGIRDINLEPGETESEAVVNWVSPEAKERGVSVGDKVLNPDAMIKGEIGTSVTFLVKSGDAPAREVTFIRKSPDEDGVIKALRTHLYFAAIFLWVLVPSIGLLSLAAFWFRSDAWLAFLAVAAVINFISLGNLTAPLSVHFFFRSYFLTALILFLILFPNGRLNPKWLWMFVFLPWPGIIARAGCAINQAFYDFCGDWHAYTHAVFQGGFGPFLILLILCGIVYWYRKAFTLIEQRLMKWLFGGLLLFFIPNQALLLLGLSMRSIQTLNTIRSISWGQASIADFFIESFLSLGPISILLVLGTVVYRYRKTFVPLERQQMKWLIFNLSLCVPPIIVLKIFTEYYSIIFYQYNKLVIIGHIVDGIFLFELAAFAFFALLASRRYRLQDVDLFINRALVYGGLILVASVVCFFSGVLADYVHERILIYGHGDYRFDKTPLLHNELLIALASALIFAAIFRPVRAGVQKFADSFFINLNFTDVFPECSLEMRLLFTQIELSKILAARSVEKLGVAYAAIFLKNKNGKLRHIKTASMSTKAPTPVIGTQALSVLEKGELAVPDGDSAHSLMIPLTVPRGQKPDFIGVLVLGPRLDKLEYSVPTAKRLKGFGQEIGKALYTAQMRKQR